MEPYTPAPADVFRKCGDDIVGERQTYGTLLSSSTTEWGRVARFATNIPLDILQDMDLQQYTTVYLQITFHAPDSVFS
jgi:hypothetical protein